MRFLVAALVAQLAAAPVWAQPASAPSSQPVLLEMPMGRAVSTPQGRLQGFNLTEFQLLLRIHTDYRAWGKQVPLFTLQVKALEDQVENQKLQVKLVQEQKITLQGEVDRLTKKWHDENEKRLRCENKPALGSWLAWGTAGLFALATAVLTGILIAHK